MDNANQLTVLIVDDEPLITIFLKRIVNKMGERVVGICYDGETATREIKSKKPDLIFMDINIKGPLDGISVIRKAVNYDPIIYYISAYNNNEIINEALSTNPYNYLIKPISEEDIRIALRIGKRAMNKQANNLSRHLYLSEELYYDCNTQELVQNGVFLPLSATEKKIVDLFVSKLRVNLSLDDIKEGVWKEKEISISTVRDSISNLRKKIPQLNIETNFGRGYVLHPV